MLGMRNWSRRLRPQRKPSVRGLDIASSCDLLLNLPTLLAAPVVVSSAELLERRGRFFVRLRSRDGVEGVALCHERLVCLWPVMTQRVLPLVIGQDVRRVEELIDALGRHDGNYKFAGLPFWTCVAAVEFALFDLLGHATGKSVGELLGEVLHPRIPVYLSSLRRETTPWEECVRMTERLAQTGATAAKFKIGGRMGRLDASPGRTNQLVARARRTLGDDITLLVDANGSYTAPQATEVGRMLESHRVSVFEEPCPWEDFEATKEVADNLQSIRVAVGEQDTSLAKFRWYFTHRAIGLVQPDVINNGGFVRTLRVARLAAEAGLDVSYHCAKSDYLACYTLHIASVTPNLWQFQELLDEPSRADSGYAPHFEVCNGMVTVPTGPGLGMTIDPAELRRARKIG